MSNEKKRYRVWMTEEVVRIVTVEAESKEGAETLVQEMRENGDFPEEPAEMFCNDVDYSAHEITNPEEWV